MTTTPESLSDLVPQSEWPLVIRVEDSGWLFDPDIIDGRPVWEWQDKTGRLTHRVTLEGPHQNVSWEVRFGDRTLTHRHSFLKGPAAALKWINEHRRAGWDEEMARDAYTEYEEQQ